MNKFTILFLTLFLALPIAMKADSAKEKKDDSRYLVGAVPEVDGKVIFSKEFQIPGMSQAQIYDTVMKWMTERLKENQNVDSRVVYADEDKGTIAGIGEEWIVFSSSALSLDRTLINYQITVTCKPGNCLVELEKIRFTYRDTEKYKAEEWITDKYALNKTKTKLVRGLAKWRRYIYGCSCSLRSSGYPSENREKEERRRTKGSVDRYSHRPDCYWRGR